MAAQPVVRDTILSIVPPCTPELLPEVQKAIKEKLADGGRVFEYGSGFSTVWFAEFADVVSVEDHPGWFAEVNAGLERAGLEAEVLFARTKSIADQIDACGMFDLVLVDCWDYERMASLERCKAHVKPGGWVVLDDSHWPMLADADNVMTGWDSLQIGGHLTRHNGLIRYHQTTIYTMNKVYA